MRLPPSACGNSGAPVDHSGKRQVLGGYYWTLFATASAAQSTVLLLAILPVSRKTLSAPEKGTGIRRWFLYARAAYIRKILRILLRSADHVFAQSQKMVGTLVSMGGTRAA